MFPRICLLCLICCCRSVIGRLPVDVAPINTFKNIDGHSVSKFSGVYGIVFFNKSFYILAKNQVTSLKVVSENDGGTASHLTKEIISWPSSTSADALCKVKTRDVEACNNFIRIFAPKDDSGKEFLVCGSHSYKPMCRNYVIEGGNFKSNSEFSGSSICPYDPKQTGATIYTDGNLYSATVEDFLGRKPVIYRHAVKSDSSNLKRAKRDEPWLMDPGFVKIVESGPKVYIFFKESAVEDNTGLTYSRVAQICKADEGGEYILRKQFTSYQKARLNCSFPGNPPFYFDEVSAVTDFVELPSLPGQKIIFAAMNTPSNSIWGSAVCAFMEKDIEDTFLGSYTEQHTVEQGATYWSEIESDGSVTEALSRCQFDANGKSVLTNEHLQFVRDHPLKSHSVPSWSSGGKQSIPIFMKLNSMYQFTAIAYDSKAGSTGLYFVIILGTTDGKILKIVPPFLRSLTETHFIGETNVYNEEICGSNGSATEKMVRDIKIDKESGFLLVAFSSCVVSIPLCPITSKCQRACISAQDPYCAWDGNECVGVTKPQGLQQDVINGDVTGMAPCPIKETVPPIGPGVIDLEEDGTDLTQANTTGPPNVNVTAIKSAAKESTTVFAAVKMSSFQSDIYPGLIGAAIILVIVVFIWLIFYCRHKRANQGSMKTEMNGGISSRKSKKKLLKEEKRNSQMVRPDRLISNSSGRQLSKRSNSSADDDIFFENASEGHVNSMEKTKRKREKSANRKSNTSSYRREDSLEKQANISVNRQTSRESNPDKKSGKVETPTEHEKMFVSTELHQPPSPPQNPFHRTFSTGNGRNDGMQQRNNRQVKRQLSLQIPINSNGPPKYYPNMTTPVRLNLQNPLEIYNQQTAPMQGNFDHVTGPGWHTPQVKTPGRQYQTTSLDRKMLKAGGMAQSQHQQKGQASQRGYSDTLPHLINNEDMKGQGRRRYPSESVVIGGNRPPPLYFVAKQPVYSSIEEEQLSPVPEQQHSPIKYPTNMQRQGVGMRPETLQLGAVPDVRPQFVVPYSNPGTPMTEHIPHITMSPHHTSGYTLPPHIRRQHSEIPSTRYINQPPHHDMTPFPHPQSAPSFASVERQSKSNPSTPEWDGNHNNFFPEQPIPNDLRNRHASGKSQGTPTTPPVKIFPGHIGHVDVLPTTNNKRVEGRAPADGVAETQYMSTNETKT